MATASIMLAGQPYSSIYWIAAALCCSIYAWGEIRWATVWTVETATNREVRHKVITVIFFGTFIPHGFCPSSFFATGKAHRERGELICLCVHRWQVDRLS